MLLYKATYKRGTKKLALGAYDVGQFSEFVSAILVIMFRGSM